MKNLQADLEKLIILNIGKSLFKISNSCFQFYFQWVSDGQGLTDDIQTTLEDEQNENENDQDDLNSDLLTLLLLLFTMS